VELGALHQKNEVPPPLLAVGESVIKCSSPLNMCGYTCYSTIIAVQMNIST
jgi:hypothetical protein